MLYPHSAGPDGFNHQHQPSTLNGTLPRMKNYLYQLGMVLCVASVVGCAHQEESRTVAVQKVVSASQSFSGPHSPILVGKFDNRSPYMRGVFSGRHPLQ